MPSTAYLARRALLLALLTRPTLAQAPAHVGFDRNDYPGDQALLTLRQHFEFTGYWLNPPPEQTASTWLGHRDTLLRAGFGFLLLWNGKLDAEILAAAHAGTTPDALGRAQGTAAVQAARAEHFPPNAILFLDQEEGGRLLPEQAAFLLSWTETVARAGFRPGVYASGQPVDDGPAIAPARARRTITTAADITDHVRSQLLHPVALWIAQDTCPPSNGCSLSPPPISASGTPGAPVWQYAQSPRRPVLTRTCARTYRPDGNCAIPELPAVHLDLSVADSPDPSHGR